MKSMLACMVAGALVAPSALARPAERELTGVLNLNTASEKELAMLPGIGPKRAKLIVEYRGQKTFEKPEDVRKIRGVGRGVFAKIKDHVSVQGTTTLTVVTGRAQPAATSAAAPAGKAKAGTAPAAKPLPRK